jgi:cytochrome c oxidase subunit 2
MEKRCRLLFVLVGLVGMTIASADDDLPIPSEDLVYCTVCHGIQLMGNDAIKAPRLSGMEAWYVEQQLKNFKTGVRGLHEGDAIGIDMQPMAAALSDDQIIAAAEFTNATHSPPPPVTVEGDIENGKRLYSTCAACHGVNGEGNEALGAPSLTVANDWYLVTQLRNFKDGVRGAHPSDMYGMQMRASAGLLADDEAIDDVVNYINTLQDQ